MLISLSNVLAVLYANEACCALLQGELVNVIVNQETKLSERQRSSGVTYSSLPLHSLLLPFINPQLLRCGFQEQVHPLHACVQVSFKPELSTSSTACFSCIAIKVIYGSLLVYGTLCVTLRAYLLLSWELAVDQVALQYLSRHLVGQLDLLPGASLLAIGICPAA